ncbi:MAG TPA: PilZ domain-containing protein [Candidatus Acidoferrales bacterium]|nr:PilZ domain-containing protein [Candidatus Acidoferrales bacterium]
MTDAESHVAVRRTQRVQIAMPVLVRGPNFQEMATTVAVNAHGCLVLLNAPLLFHRNQEIFLVNPKTAEELPGRVVSLGKLEDGKIPVGVQFAEPSPLFWRINFPPDDWHTSAERKRHGTSTPGKK